MLINQKIVKDVNQSKDSQNKNVNQSKDSQRC